jgi:hypothetical protein
MTGRVLGSFWDRLPFLPQLIMEVIWLWTPHELSDVKCHDFYRLAF